MPQPGTATAGADARPRSGRKRWIGAGLLVVTAVALVWMMWHAPGGRAVDVLLRASPRWALAAVLAAVVPVLAMTGAVSALAPHRLPLLRTTVVQLATSFPNALAPAGTGAVALNARYLQCSGVPLAQAVAVMAVVQLTSVLLTVAVLALLLLATGDLVAAVSALPLLGGVLLLGALTCGTLLALRWGRLRSLVVRRLVEPVRRVWPQLREALADPSRIALLTASHVLVTAGLGLTLWCCLRAFGIELGVTPLMLALLAGTAVGSAAPVPGGIGTVEAATAGALLAAGVPAADAVAVAVLYRLITFWGRLPLGWVSLLWLRRRGAV